MNFILWIRESRHRNLSSAMGWLLLIPLFCPCFGQSQDYHGLTYSVSGTNITITGYFGRGGNVTIPSSIPGVNGSVTDIADYTFENWGALTGITIPDSVTNIGFMVFAGCGLTSVSIPSSVISIGREAFDFCNSLTNVTIGSGVTSIGEEAFLLCDGLTSVTVPNSVTNIGVRAFKVCTRLTSITIGDGVTSIGTNAFACCTSLKAFTVDSQNPAYATLNGVLFDKTQSLLIQHPAGLAGAYTIPSSVTSIGGAFKSCLKLTSAMIGNSVTNIGEEAFYDCTGLTNVAIGDSVASIGDSAFWHCTNLTSVTLPDGVTSIGTSAFDGCSSLTSAYFQGNAPSSFGAEVFDYTAPQFSIYYPSTATGWSTPTWNGYPAQPYTYTPPKQLPVLSLRRGLGTVTPSFSSLGLGTNYQLQVSTDLYTWTNTGAAFAATNTSEAYPQAFGVTSGDHLFFRLQSP